MRSARGPAAKVRKSAADPLSRIARDPDAFEVFYREHVTAITRFVARRTSNPHAVADLTMEVFLAAISSADTYQPERGSHAAWLFGIARNVIAGERRRTAHELRAAGRIAGHRLLEEDDIARLEERIDAESPGRTAYLALARLPAEERAVLPRQTAPATFVVLHRGGDAAAYLNAYTWVWDNALHMRGAVAAQPALGCPDQDPTHFMPLDQPWIGCVWELPPIQHERDAWVRHMLMPDEADLAGYLADTMPSGTTGAMG